MPDGLFNSPPASPLPTLVSLQVSPQLTSKWVWSAPSAFLVLPKCYSQLEPKCPSLSQSELSSSFLLPVKLGSSVKDQGLQMCLQPSLATKPEGSSSPPEHTRPLVSLTHPQRTPSNTPPTLPSRQAISGSGTRPETSFIGLSTVLCSKCAKPA